VDVDTLRYGAWTHDSYRSRFDILGTIFNYQLHGRRASENLEDILERGGLPLPKDPAVIGRIKEIDRYHDVDNRPLDERSREVELFTTIDKLEMVRLFRSTQLRFRLPGVAQGIHSIAKKRMKAYEGASAELMPIMGKFLPIVDGLYRLTMQDIAMQRKSGAKWEEIDQQGAVIRAGASLGLIADDRITNMSKGESRTDSSYRTLQSYWHIARYGTKDKRIDALALLARPENKTQTIRSAKRMVESLGLSAKDTITEQTIRRYKPTRKLFLNPLTQVLDSSSHNILHAGATEVLAGSVSSAVTKTNRGQEINKQAVLLAGTLHDSQRLTNLPETIFARQAHATRAANKTPELLRKMGLSVDLATESLIGGLIRYHDMVITPHDADSNLQTLQLADNLGMVRFLLKQSSIPLVGRRINTMVDNVKQQSVIDKLLDFAPLNQDIDSVKMPYITIALALYLLAEEKAQELKKQTPFSQRRSRDYQFEAVLQAAKELGLIQ